MSPSNLPKQDPAQPNEDPFVGTEYRVMSHLGSGGMGEVYVVEHRTLGHPYAAKLLRAAHAMDKRIVDRMRLEAHSLAKLHHPNIVQINGFSTTPAGLPFIVMELLKGRTLKDELAASGALPLNLAFLYAIDLLHGLEAVHSLGIVHRDIKPSNLFIHSDDKVPSILKMLDFGVARVVPGLSDDSPEPLSVPTGTGTIAGTPLFVSPEAALGHPVDIRTDIYNAAIVLYVMLVGRGPFDDQGDDEAIIQAHAHLEPPVPSQFMDHWLGTRIDRVVLRGLAKNPQDRYQTASEFADALYELVQECMEANATEGERSRPDSMSPRASGTRSPDIVRNEPRTQNTDASRVTHSLHQLPMRSLIFILVAGLTALLIRLGLQWSLMF